MYYFLRVKKILKINIHVMDVYTVHVRFDLTTPVKTKK